MKRKYQVAPFKTGRDTLASKIGESPHRTPQKTVHDSYPSHGSSYTSSLTTPVCEPVRGTFRAYGLSSRMNQSHLLRQVLCDGFQSFLH